MDHLLTMSMGRSNERRPKLSVMSNGSKLAGHAFISYVREDAHRVDRLQRILEQAGISVWRDTADLWPGEDWRTKIRYAITDDALVFIACFSEASLARSKSYQNEEFVLAIEQLRLRRPDVPWLIPVRFDECDIPDRDIGGGRSLTSIQYADLFGEHFTEGADRLVQVVRRILEYSTNATSAKVKTAASNTGSDRPPVRYRPAVRNAATITVGRPRRVIEAIGFSPRDGILATGSGDNTVMLWDVSESDSPTRIASLTGHTSRVRAVAFSPNGRTLASGSLDKTVMLWNVSSPAQPALIRTLTAHDGWVAAVGFSVDGATLATSGADDTVILWDTSDPERCARIATIPEDHRFILSLAFSPDRRTLATAGAAMEVIRKRYDTVTLWDISNPIRPRRFAQLKGHSGREESVGFSSDGRILAIAGDDKTVRLWDVSDPAQPRQLPSLTDHRGPVTAAAFSPISPTLATGSIDKTVMLWDVADPIRAARFATLTDHHSHVFSVRFSPDGLLATSGKDGKVRLWKVS
jgi:WD40 repeat protein